MGIENFHSWLRGVYFRAIKPCNQYHYEHVYIDLNFMLHRVIPYVSSEQELFDGVMNSITTIVQSNVPTKTLTLAADGSASYAKIMLQKKRRLQMIQNISQQNETSTQPKMSGMMLTAGTVVMDMFNVAIATYVDATLKKILSPNVTIKLNLSDQPDESEFKICRSLCENSLCCFDNHLVISNDADVVLIMIAQLHTYNINILIQFSKNNKYIISIDDLVEQFMEKFGYNFQKRYDFVLLSILCGNDYLPKLKYTNFDKLWCSYEKLIRQRETIVDHTGMINMKQLERLMMSLVSTNSAIHNHVSPMDLCNDDTYTYLMGLQWCMSLYIDGDYTMYDYVYNGDSPNPLCVALTISTRHLNVLNLSRYVGQKIPSDIYPVLILPHSAKCLVKTKYHSIIDHELSYMFEQELCVICQQYRERIAGSCDRKLRDEFSKHKKTHHIDDPQNYIATIVDKLNIIN